MSKNIENKYANLKNYELESMFDLSKKQKEQLTKSIDPKTKHTLKLQEMYLKVKTYSFSQLEEEVLAYVNHHEYLLEKDQIGKFYELLAFAGASYNTETERKYLNLAVENCPTSYSLKRSIYFALEDKNIYMAARLMLIAIESDAKFDEELSYYNLVVEHYFEDDIIEYYKLMEDFQDRFISVDNVTIEFSFNKLVANYYIQKHIKQSDNKEVMKAKKAVNELLLKAISSMKDEGELRSEVLRVREALAQIDANPEVDIFSLISFSLLPKPKGEPDSSPLRKLK